MTSQPDPTPPKPEKPEVRLAWKTAQTLVQWMPLGGSLYFVGHAMLQQAWLQALLAFPVAIVTGIWAAYTENFVAKLREIYSDRAEADAQALVSWMDGLDRALRWQLSNVDGQYRRCQAGACRDFASDEMKLREGIFNPLLAEIYVALQLSNEFVRGADGRNLPLPPGFRRQDRDDLKTLLEKDRLTIWDFLKRTERVPAYRRMAILAWGGSGKTTLLRNLTRSHAEPSRLPNRRRSPNRLPVLLYLRKWHDLLAAEGAPDLPTLVVRHHIPSLPEGEKLKLPPRWAKHWLGTGRGLVLVDGFDEVPEHQRSAVSHWIAAQMDAYPQSVFIVTSRPGGYEDYAAQKPSTSLMLKPFNAAQRQEFVRKWYRCQERYQRGGRDTAAVRDTADRQAENLIAQMTARPELEDMAGNPLMLNMLAMLHQFYGDRLPKRRSEMYEDICRMQLKDRPRAKGIELQLTYEDNSAVLQQLALEMVRQDRARLARAELLPRLESILLERGVWIRAERWIEEIVETSELMVEREAGEYEFAHLSFQNYLAAAKIRATAQENLLLEHWNEAHWREPILLYVGQANEAGATQVVEALANLEQRTALVLAYHCTPEARRIRAEVTQDIRTKLYAPLADYMQKGDWESADGETWKLMCALAGREAQGWLDEESIQKFPCEDLRAIDDLWVRHSNGKFGFSVQKKIYVACGAKLDGQYPGVTIWEKFGVVLRK